jgi:hypothetical protein
MPTSLRRRPKLADRLAVPAGPFGDRQTVGRLLAGRAEEAALRDRATTALAGIEVASLDEVITALRGIGRCADAIRERMVEVGRELTRLQAAAGPGGYKALRLAGLVPFDDGTASRLRAVAAAIDSGMIPPDRLPRALVPAARAARLAPEVAARLIEAGVLGPAATARQIEEAIRAPEPSADTRMTGPERQRLERRLAAIAATMARLKFEAEEIRARLAEG